MEIQILELSSYKNIQDLIADSEHKAYETILSPTEVIEVFIAWQIDIGALCRVTTIPAR